jgi:septum formation protein
MGNGLMQKKPLVGNQCCIMKSLDALKKYDILLASASPRRKELLSQLGITFEVAPSIEVDESYPTQMDAYEVAPHLSKLKADAYRQLIIDNQLIITADTVVINNGEVLGKPMSVQHAKVMLESLSSHSHSVVTGVTITTLEKQVTFAVNTEVEFAQLSSQEIDDYVDNFTPLDKAGAYGIQEWIGCIGVKNIKGSFYNVMGLPLHRLYEELKNF